MNTTNIVGVGALVLIVLGGIYFAYNTAATNNQTAVLEPEAAMEMEDTMMDDAGMTENDTMEAEEITTTSEATVETTSSGTYAVYSAEQVSNAGNNDVVLFFKASWCPSCRALDNDIRNSLGDIPAGLTILEVDFDSSQELRQRYGVTTQHTLVQIDSNGELVKKWSGGNTLEVAIAEVI